MEDQGEERQLFQILINFCSAQIENGGRFYYNESEKGGISRPKVPDSEIIYILLGGSPCWIRST